MIISASRRTDISAFYSEWFTNRIRAGYCTVPNPMNPKQISRISLDANDVTAFVFWTRNARPMLKYLSELNDLGYRYYFQFTILDNPRAIDHKNPSLDSAIDTFQQLSEQIGARRVIWRYDPIVLSNLTPIDYHVEKYRIIAERLKGYTHRSVISIVDRYRKANTRLEEMHRNGVELIEGNLALEQAAHLIPELESIARQQGFEIQSCAETIDLTPYQVHPGKCIDNHLLQSIFELDTTTKKDSGQRDTCGCVKSRDIGMYDTCLFGCQYCYATTSFDKASENFKQHDPLSPSLIGWYEAEDRGIQQLRLF